MLASKDSKNPWSQLAEGNDEGITLRVSIAYPLALVRGVRIIMLGPNVLVLDQ